MSTTTRKREKRDIRLGVYRGLAGLVSLFLLAISATWLPWPFGLVVFADVADPEAARWYAGLWGAFMTLMTAVPLIATIRRPRETTGLLQFFLIGYAAVMVSSIWVFGEVDLVMPIAMLILIAAHPERRSLFSVPHGNLDRRLLGITILAGIALIPFVQDNLSMDKADLGSELQTTGVYWHAVWVTWLTLLGGVMASMRVRGWKTLLTILGSTFVYLGAASIAVPDHVGSWGVLIGGVAVAAGAAVIAYPRFVEEEAVPGRPSG